jgi:hypothetical protein
MFEDLGEQEHVFSLLDEWANDQTESDLTYQTGSKSKFSEEITKLINAVESKELETIKKNPKLKLGFSFQSELLAKLQLSLILSNTQPKLLENLPGIKILLLQAMIIGIDVKNDTLQLLAAVGKAVKDGGKAAHEKTYGTDEDKTKKRKEWQTWVDEEIEKHKDYSFENIKKLVVKNHPGEVSEAQLKRYTKDTRKT